MAMQTMLPPSRVVVAPMAGGPSTTALILAAAKAGALPFIAGGNRTTADLEQQILEVEAGTRVFGVNLFVPSALDPTSMPVDEAALREGLQRLQPLAEQLGVQVEAPRAHDDHWQEKCELLLRHPVPVVGFTFGCPPEPLVAALHAAGSAVAVAVTTEDEALTAARAGADALVVQSGQAGGHSASWHPASLAPSTRTPELVRAISGRLLREFGETARPIIIAAGGITTSAAADAAIAAGADAVQAGTAFLVAAEAGTRAPHRAALLAGERDTVMSRSLTGRPARMLVNAATKALDAHAPLAYPHIQSATAGIRAASLAAESIEHFTAYAGTEYRLAVPGSAAEVVARITPTQR